MRRTRAAVFRVDRDLLPPRLVQALPRFLETRRGDDLARLDAAALVVAHGVERPAHFAHPAIASRERRLALVDPPRFERRSAEKLLQPELFEEKKVDLPQVHLV